MRASLGGAGELRGVERHTKTPAGHRADLLCHPDERLSAGVGRSGRRCPADGRVRPDGAHRPRPDRAHRGDDRAGRRRSGETVLRQWARMSELPSGCGHEEVRVAARGRLGRLSTVHRPRERGADAGGPDQRLYGAQHERPRAAAGRPGNEGDADVYPVHQCRRADRARRRGTGGAAGPVANRGERSETRRETVFAETCAVCHQANGQGKRWGPEDAAQRHRYQFPPLWGPDSYNDGAGMARPITAANFIRANMPIGDRLRHTLC